MTQGRHRLDSHHPRARPSSFEHFDRAACAGSDIQDAADRSAHLCETHERAERLAVFVARAKVHGVVVFRRSRTVFALRFRFFRHGGPPFPARSWAGAAQVLCETK
jgi:hypothetical protein